MSTGEAQNRQRRRHPFRHDVPGLRKLRRSTQDLSRQVPRSKHPSVFLPPYPTLPHPFSLFYPLQMEVSYVFSKHLSLYPTIVPRKFIKQNVEHPN